MILFCGIPSEPPLALAIAAAERLEIPHVVFNQRDSRGAQLVLDFDERGATGTLRTRGQEYDLSSFTGIYTRMIHPAQLPEFRSPSARLADDGGMRRAMAAADVLEQWTQIAPCRVANRPRPMVSNASKPYQAQLIARAGFAIPPTLVTNSRQSLAAFEAEHGRVIYKSISGERSIVQELTDAVRPRLRHLRSLPTQFQAVITGDDVRVHVVDREVFATQISTTATDYRYAHRQGSEAVLSAVELPADVAERCVRLAALLELPFCGIDLKRTPDGEHYCFEANPSPAYSYYQESTGQPIADRLVRWLSGGPD